MKSSWTPDDRDRLRQLQAAGFSCSQIGEALGKTKNAVAGQLFRSGLMTRRPPKQMFRVANGAAAYELLPTNPDKPRQTPTNADKPEKPPPDHHRGRLTILELRPSSCRWPMAGKTYCGLETTPGRPYCPEHTRRAYYPGRLPR